jgi:hypothetical protein
MSLPGTGQKLKKCMAGGAQIANAVGRRERGDMGQDATATLWEEKSLHKGYIVVEKINVFVSVCCEFSSLVKKKDSVASLACLMNQSYNAKNVFFLFRKHYYSPYDVIQIYLFVFCDQAL